MCNRGNDPTADERGVMHSPAITTENSEDARSDSSQLQCLTIKPNMSTEQAILQKLQRRVMSRVEGGAASGQDRIATRQEVEQMLVLQRGGAHDHRHQRIRRLHAIPHISPRPEAFEHALTEGSASSNTAFAEWRLTFDTCRHAEIAGSQDNPTSGFCLVMQSTTDRCWPCKYGAESDGMKLLPQGAISPQASA